jgi:hypothetical protein
MSRQMRNDNEFFKFESHSNDLVAALGKVVLVRPADFLDQTMHMQVLHEPGDLSSVFPLELAPQMFVLKAAVLVRRNPAIPSA